MPTRKMRWPFVMASGARGMEHAFEEMMAFWNGRLPFTGDILHWSKQMEAKKCRSRR